MNVLIIGSGGREHALAWKIKQSPLVKKLYCIPGNGGIAQIAECVLIKTENFSELIAFAKEKEISLVVVGPEAPLAEGIVDAFEGAKIRIFGPTQKAARLEASKVFAKEFMRRHRIPTADFEVFDHPDEATAFLSQAEYPIVIKADGLAAGKGVIICQNPKEAKQAIGDIMRKKVFKAAGNKVVIEECLKGEEASILAISDGSGFVMLESSQDHKRIFDDDQGPNTGGMGAYSPAPVITRSVLRNIAFDIISPTIEGMRQDGHVFKGVLYAGLMMTPEGPRVLEFNVRFGDPETQAVLPRLKNDLVELMLGACEGKLSRVKLTWDPRPCVCVVMASRGYPGEYEKGKEIFGLESAGRLKDTVVFHAGTKKESGKILTTGGRVLGVTSLGLNIEEAIKNTYQAVEKISFDGCFFRRDIGAKALNRNKNALV